MIKQTNIKRATFKGQTVRTRQSEVKGLSVRDKLFLWKTAKIYTITGLRPSYNEAFQVASLEKVYLRKIRTRSCSLDFAKLI